MVFGIRKSYGNLEKRAVIYSSNTKDAAYVKGYQIELDSFRFYEKLKDEIFVSPQHNQLFHQLRV